MVTTTHPRGKRSRKWAPRPKMTAEQATTFDAVSESSFIAVEDALAQRREDGVYEDCRCNPYEDVYTFGRWKAQGMSVCKGERSIRVGSWTPIERRQRDPNYQPEPAATEESGEEGGEASGSKRKLRPVTLHLFCRCQVAASNEKRPA